MESFGGNSIDGSDVDGNDVNGSDINTGLAADETRLLLNPIENGWIISSRATKLLGSEPVIKHSTWHASQIKSDHVN